MATTFRSDAAAAIQTLLTTFQTANPTLLRKVKRARPENVGETPVAWIGDISETITHDSGVRGRTFAIPVAIVDQLSDSDENADRMDDLVDALIDVFTANPHAVANCLIEPTGVSELGIEGPFHGVAIVLRGRIQEGRS